MTSTYRRDWWIGFSAANLSGLALFTSIVILASATHPPVMDRGFGIGWAVGMVILFLPHPYRGLGLAPYAATGLLAVATYGLITGDWIGWLLGLLIGLSLAGPAILPRLEWRWHRLLVAWVIAAVIGLGELTLLAWFPVERLGIALVVITGLLTAHNWFFFFRPAFELTCEPLLWLMYRIRVAGPGLKQVPARGPVLVVANHACWFDPLFLAKVLPRPVTPMMTSRFYDLPVMSWLMRRVFHSIRVPEKPSKEEMPEAIRQAIAALDRGECVVIFPEGFLRRTEEKPLRRFGRGVWQILAARPETPVFCCWIEGGWGSYASYFNGKPTKNKRPDFRRPIGVGVSAPVMVDAPTLANHLQTRVYLMNRVAEARTLLGLPGLPVFELPAAEGKDDEEE